jgi:hypothetical protein
MPASVAAAPKAARATPQALPAVPYCTARDLGIHFVLTQGGLGHVFSRFEFVNVTSRACRLQGYPGVSAYTRSGARIRLALTRDTSERPHLVILGPGRRTPFMFTTFDEGIGPWCQTSAVLRFIPPNSSAYEQIAHRQLICRRHKASAAPASVGPVGNPR